MGWNESIWPSNRHPREVYKQMIDLVYAVEERLAVSDHYENQHFIMTSDEWRDDYALRHGGDYENLDLEWAFYKVGRCSGVVNSGYAPLPPHWEMFAARAPNALFFWLKCVLYRMAPSFLDPVAIAGGDSVNENQVESWIESNSTHPYRDVIAHVFHAGTVPALPAIGDDIGAFMVGLGLPHNYLQYGYSTFAPPRAISGAGDLGVIEFEYEGETVEYELNQYSVEGMKTILSSMLYKPYSARFSDYNTYLHTLEDGDSEHIYIIHDGSGSNSCHDSDEDDHGSCTLGWPSVVSDFNEDWNDGGHDKTYYPYADIFPPFPYSQIAAAVSYSSRSELKGLDEWYSNTKSGHLEADVFSSFFGIDFPSTLPSFLTGENNVPVRNANVHAFVYSIAPGYSFFNCEGDERSRVYHANGEDISNLHWTYFSVGYLQESSLRAYTLPASPPGTWSPPWGTDERHSLCTRLFGATGQPSLAPNPGAPSLVPYPDHPNFVFGNKRIDKGAIVSTSVIPYGGGGWPGYLDFTSSMEYK